MKNNHHTILQFSLLDTPLGTMLAVANEQALYVLDFVDRHNLEHTIEQLKIKTKSAIIPGRARHIDSIEQELALYFAGCLKEFKTPVHLAGSLFQQNVWNSLICIPYGTTISYAQEARMIGKPSAHRAVANANGANQLVIIIPCHRIIRSDGNLGGYGAGITRKQWLLNHEKRTYKKIM